MGIDGSNYAYKPLAIEGAIYYLLGLDNNWAWFAKGWTTVYLQRETLGPCLVTRSIFFCIVQHAVVWTPHGIPQRHI